MQVDYTTQLQEIAKALNRPSIPTWLIAILSGLVGFLASVFSQVFQHWYAERSAQNRMRMIVYSEIGSSYSHLVHFHDLKTSHNSEQEDMNG